MLAEVGNTKEGKSTILSWFGKGDLVKAKKEINSKEAEISKLKSQIRILQKNNAEQVEKHKLEIRSLKNGYQIEIAKAIQRAEDAEKKVAKLESSNEMKSRQISALERKAYPERYTLSSGAKLAHLFVPNYIHPSLHIWTKVGDEEYENTKYDVDYNVVKAHRDGKMTDEESVNAVFEPMEQVNQIQAQLLGAAFILASGGPAQVHIGTGGGGSSSDLPWGKKKKDKDGMRR